MKNQEKLTENPLWKAANVLAEYMYSKLDDFEQFPDEKWNTERKIRNAANDVIFFIAQAAGNALPDAAEYDWNNARKNLFALRTMYTFAHKQKFVTVDPDIIVKIDGLLANIDNEIGNTKREIEKKSKEDIKPWLEKYQLWKEMQGLSRN
jgi:site-specific recombinase XerD